VIDLTTQYMSLALKNPLVASASPLTESVDNLRHLEDSGIAAVVLPSLFEEQLTFESVLIDQDLSRGAEEFAEAITYLPNLESYNTGPEGYLELIHRAKQAVAIPIIASLTAPRLVAGFVMPVKWNKLAPMLSSSTSTRSKPTRTKAVTPLKTAIANSCTR